MKLPRRNFLHLAAGAAALSAASRIASALDYPSRPVRIIVAYATGGPNDFFARLIGQWLSERLGQQLIADATGVMEVHPSVPARSVPDLIRTYLKIARRSRSAINVG